MTQSSEITGGAGFNFEAAVAAIYMAALVAEETAPALNNRIVSWVGLQQKGFGEPLDDVIVDACSNSGEIARLSLQVKRSLTVSDAASNDDFREIVRNCWETLSKKDFKENIDLYGVATGTIAESSRRDLNSVCDFARASLDVRSFFRRFEKDGTAGQNHFVIIKYFRSILNEFKEQAVSDHDIYRFAKHFVLVKFDYLHEGATDGVAAVAQLRHTLAESDHHRAADLWNRLVTLAREGAGRSEAFNRVSILTKLAGDFRFTGAPSIKADLNQLTQLANLWFDDIASDIDGYHIVRQSILANVKELLDTHRFVQIRGLPGTGKSVILRQFAKRRLADGPILFLKSDRLSGCSWAEFSKNIGLVVKNVEILLSEIAAAGTPVLFVDGIDRIQPAQRKIVLDLLNTILASPLLTNWRIVATARDIGIEPLRNWVPSKLYSDGGIGTVNVKPLDDAEADGLAKAKPSLRPLLFGIERVREIARRPFFAAVLARCLSVTKIQKGFAPQSEVDLIQAWWEGGGYQADPDDIYKRQHALDELAKISSRRLGLKIFRSELSDGTIGVLHHLMSDGIVSEIQKGVSFRFAHDIFFEWSYFYLLQGKADKWVEDLVGAGEPPVLGRVVELLSQSYFTTDSGWLLHLSKIEASSLRPQWQRAWLLGPFGATNFWDQEKSFTKVISQDDFRRLRRLFVWFQAEKTTPNELVLSGQFVSNDLQKHEIIRLADALGWPSDYATWKRLIAWSLHCIDNLPCTIIPDLISVFEVWQNAFSDFKNPMSPLIVSKCMEWLIDIEDREHPEKRIYDRGKWGKLDSEELDDLEKALRTLVLRSTRFSPEVIKTYLERVTQRQRLRSHVFSDVMVFASLLAQQLPEELIEFTRAELKEELPLDTLKRWKKEQKARAAALRRIRSKPESERDCIENLSLSSPEIPQTLSHHNWDHLSIGRSIHGYFPSSPLREPFGSLFKFYPQKALALVRELTNHAMTAWLQLNEYSHDRRGTPTPIKLEFPWGQQEFWGDWPQYVWFRGMLGPQPIECALMALEDWAFREIEKERDVDDVLHDVIEGHTCWSVLGIAAMIALETQHVSKTSLALVSCQRLWSVDIRRQLEDHTNMPANLIGFNGLRGLEKADKPHYEAVKAGNSRKCRAQSLRDLTPLFVLNHDEEMRRSVREALERFPENLPFYYEEEKSSPDHVKGLRSTAEIWAEWGKHENYRESQHPSEKSLAIIQLENPKIQNQEVQAQLARHAEKSRELSLWNWVRSTFEDKSLSSSLSLSDAIQLAKQYDSSELFTAHPYSIDRDLVRGAVAGVAAAILCFTDRNKENTSWANEVISRAYETPEFEKDVFSSDAVIPWHPSLFVARALAAKIQHNIGDSVAIEQLLTLASHPLDCVSLEALRCAFICWDINDRLAWTALDLGLRLCIEPRRHWSNSSPADDRANYQNLRQQGVNAALKGYTKSRNYSDLIGPPPAWVFESPIRNGSNEENPSTEPIWRKPDTIWRWDFASKLLSQAPIDKIMRDPARKLQFMSLCDRLLTWTIEKINPPWKECKSKRRDNNGTELLKWRLYLSRVLAQVSGYIRADIAKKQFLDKIFAQEDDVCFSFLAPYVNMYICIYILDAKTVEKDTINILAASLERVLNADRFKRTGYRAGQIYGYDLPDLVRHLLFVSVEKASGAARFANGSWEEIGIVLPLIDKFVRAAGWSVSVANAFLTLCERCGPYYPAEAFADQVLAFMDTENMPAWRGTVLPARVAGLIQRYGDWQHPLKLELAQKMLRILDALVDFGDRRSAALQISEVFKDVRIAK